MEKNLLKVHFRITQNEDGYPPFTSEAMWCEKIGENRFRLESIPFFAMGVSFSDVISVHEEPGGYLNFDHVVEESGHSTIRVIFLQNLSDRRPIDVRARDLAKQLREFGCEVNLSPPPHLLAVDVPPTTAISVVRGVLSPGEEAGLWSYEEGTLAHSA